MLGYRIPTFSALCKSRKNIFPTLFKRALTLTARKNHQLVAIDSTGISRTNPRYNYIKKIYRKKPIKQLVKQSTLFDIKQRTILAVRIRLKPRHDIKDAEYLLKRAEIKTALFGDTVYDS